MTCGSLVCTCDIASYQLLSAESWRAGATTAFKTVVLLLHTVRLAVAGPNMTARVWRGLLRTCDWIKQLLCLDFYLHSMTWSWRSPSRSLCGKKDGWSYDWRISHRLCNWWSSTLPVHDTTMTWREITKFSDEFHTLGRAVALLRGAYVESDSALHWRKKPTLFWCGRSG